MVKNILTNSLNINDEKTVHFYCDVPGLLTAYFM